MTDHKPITDAELDEMQIRCIADARLFHTDLSRCIDEIRRLRKVVEECRMRLPVAPTPPNVELGDPNKDAE